MAKPLFSFEETRGDTVELDVALSNLLMPYAGYEIRCDLHAGQLLIELDNGVDGGIELVSENAPQGTAQIRLTIVPEKSEALTMETTFFGDLQLKDSNGRTTTPCRIQVKFVPDYTT